MMSDKIRNYEAAKRRRGTDIGGMPLNVSDLPLFHQTCDVHGRAVTDDAVQGHITDDYEHEVGLSVAPEAENSDDECDEGTATRSRTRFGAEAAPTSIYCGELPVGSGFADFHAPPAKIHHRSAEARYWQGFATQIHEAFPDRTDQEMRRASESSWHISTEDAMVAAERQQRFFMAVDRFDFDPEVCMSIDAKTTKPDAQKKDGKEEFERTLENAMKRLPQRPIKTDTVVMEAAFFLLQQGLLDIPDTGHINVKQASAFLWNAAWLQDHIPVFAKGGYTPPSPPSGSSCSGG